MRTEAGINTLYELRAAMTSGRKFFFRSDTEKEAIIEDTGFHAEMKRGHITQQEYIEKAIRQKKIREATEDRIFTYMLKTGPTLLAPEF